MNCKGSKSGCPTPRSIARYLNHPNTHLTHNKMARSSKHKFNRPLPPSVTDDILNRAIQSTAMRVDETCSNQDNDAPDTNRHQEQGYDADGVYRFTYRLYSLPAEIRDMVFFACHGDPIKLPGFVPNGIISLILALQNPQLRSKLVKGIWQTCPILWEGSLQSKAWERFKKTVIPHIRRLTIKFELSSEIWFNDDSEIRRTLAWMWKRGKRGNRARYLWHLEQLHLIGMRYPPRAWRLAGPGWYMWFDSPYPHCHYEHWPAHFSLTRLKKDGVKVSVDQKACCVPRGARNPSIGLYCLHSHNTKKKSTA